MIFKAPANWSSIVLGISGRWSGFNLGSLGNRGQGKRYCADAPVQRHTLGATGRKRNEIENRGSADRGPQQAGYTFATNAALPAGSPEPLCRTSDRGKKGEDASVGAFPSPIIHQNPLCRNFKTCIIFPRDINILYFLLPTVKGGIYSLIEILQGMYVGGCFSQGDPKFTLQG